DPQPGVVLVEGRTLVAPHFPRPRDPLLPFPERRFQDPAPDRARLERFPAAAPGVGQGQLRPQVAQLAYREEPIELADQVAEHRGAAVIDTQHIENPRVTDG